MIGWWSVSLAHAGPPVVVAVYDLARLPGEPEPVSWSSPEMERWCGPVEGPLGDGVTDAEAASRGDTPVLVIEVDLGQDIALDRREVDLRLLPDPARSPVPVGWEEGVRLQPMVMPRALRVRLEGDVSPQYKQALRNQLARELCGEHRTGRAWIGAPGVGEGRRMLGLSSASTETAPGEFEARAIQPPMLGPSTACFSPVPDLDYGRREAPVFPFEAHGLERCPDTLPLGVPSTWWKPGPGWSAPTTVEAVVSLRDSPPHVGLTVDGQGRLDEVPLFDGAGEDGAMRDVAAALPHRLPTRDGRLVLVVPESQLATAWQVLFPAAMQEVGDHRVSLATQATLSRLDLLSLEISMDGGPWDLDLTPRGTAFADWRSSPYGLASFGRSDDLGARWVRTSMARGWLRLLAAVGLLAVGLGGPWARRLRARLGLP